MLLQLRGSFFRRKTFKATFVSMCSSDLLCKCTVMTYLVQVNTLHNNILENNYKGPNLIALPLFPPSELVSQRGRGSRSMSERLFFTLVIQLNVMGQNVADCGARGYFYDITLQAQKLRHTYNDIFDAHCQAEPNRLITSGSEPQSSRSEDLQISQCSIHCTK